MNKNKNFPEPIYNIGNLSNVNHLSEFDIYLFKNGRHYKLYDKLGAHLKKINGVEGTYFAVWAPDAKSVSVIGDFNYWDKNSNPMGIRWDESGIWEIFTPGVGRGSLYKFHIKSKNKEFEAEKSDPYAFFCETPPKTASIVWDLEFNWNDKKWLKNRHKNNSLNSLMSIYELHIGSWRRIIEEDNRHLGYKELAEHLVRHLKKMGFTHVEFMPLMEHPFYGSWGYQTTGYFAPTSRYGTPQDLMFLIDLLHQNNIGVIFDWVPSHFPNDKHGLAYFDGTFLYEHEDIKKGVHPDWKSLIFNYGRNEVKEFLISSAIFWLDKYHIDGLRIDAVASMLYLDYSRKEGEWIPNRYGGNENLEAVEFIKTLNEVVYKEFPDVQTIAEESTAWPMVTKPTYLGGLGFGLKWNMGWMHDTLKYFCLDPIYRKFHHSELIFTFWYAFFENFILPLSHDEVVYGKMSLLKKMPGDKWQKFANLRILFAYMYAFPGKKLLFMGGEFAQVNEWHHESSLEWHLAENDDHKKISALLIDLNKLYKMEPALYNSDLYPKNFEWIDFYDWEQSIISFLRKSKTNLDADKNIKAEDANKTFMQTAGDKKIKNEKTAKKIGLICEDFILIVCNFTPAPRYNYKIGVPCGGIWKEILNSDSKEYGGSGHGNYGKVKAKKEIFHGRQFSISITLPPLSVLYFKKSINL
ncbi:MAG: 1,4-alpha-glucan branching protein GlgB [Actinobacteria bacterium]|nr:1,4-alpha-glucan branching protein GlgB [Actinomycetota bacterium]